MELFIPGKGSVRLDQSDFIGQGGEGKVYARGNTAYKVYADPSRMIPPAKIQELAVLGHHCIIRPEDVLLDSCNTPVGYTMQRVQDANPLCRLFTRAFRERKSITTDNVLALVRQFQETVQHIHEQGVLIVDLNEMNFLLDSALQSVLFIDVDSYKTPGFPPTAIMDTIRDRHSADFSVNTDWFSFAIVSFQMFIGVHPYRGKHPALPDMEARMQANVSVLNSQVTVPASCYPLDSLPPAYRDWYHALFEQGVRAAPPTQGRFSPTITPRLIPLPQALTLKVQEVMKFEAEIVQAMPSYGNDVGITTSGLFIRGRNACPRTDLFLAQTPRLKRLIATAIEGRSLRIWDTTAGHEIPSTLSADGIMRYGDRLYIKNGAGVFEIRWLELPAGVQPLLHPIANVMLYATQMMEGVAVQNILGACFASVFPTPGTCHTIHLAELDGRRIVDGKFENNVLMILSEQNGSYSNSIFRFGEDYRDYDLRVIPDIGSADLNFVTLENGICLYMNEKDELEIFSSRKGAGSLRVLNEPALQGVSLVKDGTRALFARGKTLYQMTMST